MQRPLSTVVKAAGSLHQSHAGYHFCGAIPISGLDVGREELHRRASDLSGQCAGTDGVDGTRDPAGLLGSEKAGRHAGRGGDQGDTLIVLLCSPAVVSRKSGLDTKGDWESERLGNRLRYTRPRRYTQPRPLTPKKGNPH